MGLKHNNEMGYENSMNQRPASTSNVI